mmetsp:Transcript_42182/g.66870  ORF Transcript_42182/g.66870 Transcript_42182/m.66870 type:complete len:741 (-) Transcript_42182:185-2407(-)
MFYPSASSIGLPSSGDDKAEDLKLISTHDSTSMISAHDSTSMMPNCSFHCGQTVDMGGVQAQVVGQYGTGFIIAVPANQPVPSTAWVTPTHQPGHWPDNNFMYPMMGAGGADPNFSYCQYMMMSPTAPMMMPMHDGFSPMSQVQEPIELEPIEVARNEAKTLILSSCPNLMKKTDGSTRGRTRELEQDSVPRVEEVPDTVDAQAVKIFVHGSDGALRYVGERSQGGSNSQVEVIDGLEKDWSTEMTVSSVFPTNFLEPVPPPPPKTWKDALVKSNRENDANAQQKGRQESGRELKGLYAELVNAWNNLGMSTEEEAAEKVPSEASGDDSTTIDIVASPDHSANEDDEVAPSRTSSTEAPAIASQRVRALLADGPPSAPPPAPKALEIIEETSDLAANAGQEKLGRTRSKPSGSSKNNAKPVQVTEARSAPSPTPVLPSVVKATVPVDPTPQRNAHDRPCQAQKIEKNVKTEKTEKNSKSTVSRRTPPVREEPRQPQPPEKLQQKTAPAIARGKRANTDGKSKNSKRSSWAATWALQQRRVSASVVSAKAHITKARTKARRMMKVHGKTVVLAACVLILILTTLVCFVGESKSVRTRSGSGAAYSSSSESPRGGRRAGDAQETLDFESLRAQIAQEYQRSSRQPKKGKKTCNADSRSLSTYVVKEAQYFSSLSKKDPKLAYVLGMVSSSKLDAFKNWKKTAHAFRKLMTERYGGLRTRSTNRMTTVMLLLRGMSKCVGARR